MSALQQPDDAPRATGSNSLLDPSRRLLDDAIKAVPAVKYFLAVAGLAAAASIVRVLFLNDWRAAFVGTLILFAGGVAVVVFVRLTQLAPKSLQLPAIVLTWLFIALIAAAAVCIFTGVFFGAPLDLRRWLADDANKGVRIADQNTESPPVNNPSPIDGGSGPSPGPTDGRANGVHNIGVCTPRGVVKAPRGTTAPSESGEESLYLPNVITYDKQDMTIPAADTLHRAGISIRDVTPPTSSLVIRNNRELYKGQAVSGAENILTQENRAPPNLVNVPASFTLVFDKPVTSVTFVRPALFPETDSGVSHPAWSAHALDAQGHELDSYLEPFIIRCKPHDLPSLTITLTAPASKDIFAVRFDSDYRLDGRPKAGFFAVLIERLTWTRQK